MNRHYARSIALQTLYEADFRSSLDLNTVKDIYRRHINNVEKNKEDENAKFTLEIIEKTINNIKEIDTIIINAAPDWPIEQIATLDRNALRLAIAELNYFETPPKVIINEAVELAKTFGSQASPKFVNGVMGTVYRESNKYKEEDD